MSLNESIVEDVALQWFGELGYAVGHGPYIASGELAVVRATIKNYLPVRFSRRLNP